MNNRITLYVSTIGNDNYDGLSLEKPFKTLTKAASEIKRYLNSEQILIKVSPGRYQGNFGFQTCSPQIMLTGDPQDRPIIDGWILASHNCWVSISHIDFECTSPSSGNIGLITCDKNSSVSIGSCNFKISKNMAYAIIASYGSNLMTSGSIDIEKDSSLPKSGYCFFANANSTIRLNSAVKIDGKFNSILGGQLNSNIIYGILTSSMTGNAQGKKYELFSNSCLVTTNGTDSMLVGDLAGTCDSSSFMGLLEHNIV